MRKFFSLISRIISLIFALFFIITAAFALVLININRHLLDSDIYKRAMLETNVYERLPFIIGSMLVASSAFNTCADNPIRCEDISPQLQACYVEKLGEERFISLRSGDEIPNDIETQIINSCLLQEEGNTQIPGTQIGTNGVPEYLEDLSPEEWGGIINVVLPADQLQQLMESLLDDFFNFLNGDINQVTVDLISLKSRLSGPGSNDLLNKIFSSLHPCTAEEIAYITNPPTGEFDILCNPPKDIMENISPALQDQINAAISQTPDEILIVKPINNNTSIPGDTTENNDPVKFFRSVRLIIRLSPLVPLGFISLMTLLSVRSLKNWMQWWGIPAFFTGVVILVFSILSGPSYDFLWQSEITPKIPPYLGEIFINFTEDFFAVIFHDFSERVVLQAIILLVLSAVMWISSYFFKVRQDTDENRQG